MRQQDYEIRYRLERFRALYEAGGQRFDLFPSFIDCGFNTTAALANGSTTNRVVYPAKDAPFLWLGVAMQSTQTSSARFLFAAGAVLKFTLLKSGQTFGDDKSADGTINNAVALQTTVGYDGKPALFAYPYLFEIHDQLQVQLHPDAVNAVSDQIILIGYKVIPKAA